MRDSFSAYETGLNKLSAQLGAEHPHYSEFLIYEQRLRENIHQARMYGENPAIRSSRAEIIARLNELTMYTQGVSFNQFINSDIPSPDKNYTSVDNPTPSTLSISNIRKLLVETFDDEELTILAFDHFQEVYNRYSSGMTKTAKIQRLLEYCERRNQLTDLFNLIQRERPGYLQRDVAPFSLRPTTSDPQSAPDEQQTNRIFLSYAFDDEEVVARLYDQLHSEGFDPWMADRDLLAGQNWQIEVKKNLRTADIIIVCLSHNSLNKAGYVQKEIALALDIADEQPEGTIFIIPVKLDESSVPERLRHLYPVDLLQENGYERLIQALRRRSESPSRFEADKQRELLEKYRSRLLHLLSQQAIYGKARAPIQIEHDIEAMRSEIAKAKNLLRTWGIDILDYPGDEVDEQLSQQWFDAVRNQRTNQVPQKTVQQLWDFVTKFCGKLDFIVQGDNYLYHDHIVAYRVKAPNIHLNIPTDFLLFCIISEKLSDDIVQHVAQIPHMMECINNFGLVLTTSSQIQTQERVDRLIRDSMKSDLIVLGKDFLDEIAVASNPRQILLREIMYEVDLTRVSPFMADSMAYERMFFGRESEIKNILEAMSRTSVIITCGRRMGKTTLLRRLEQVELPSHNRRCFFLDCQSIDDYGLLRSVMIRDWKKNDLPFDPKQPYSFVHVVDALVETNGDVPIFLLDEIDRLLKYDSQNEYALFRQFRALSLAGQARFIMTGERTVQTQVHDANSPLFNFGLVIRLSFLEFEPVKKLILDPLSDMKIELQQPKDMVDIIFNATSGHPYLVQRLCYGLIEKVNKQKARIIEPDYIDEVLDDSNYQREYFSSVWGQAPLLARLVTMLIRNEGATIDEIQDQLRRYKIYPSLQELNKAVDILELYSVLERKKGRYEFIATAFPDMVQRAYEHDIEMRIKLLCEEYLCQQ